MTNLKAILIVVIGGPLVGLLLFLALWLYWYLESVPKLPSTDHYKTLVLQEGDSTALAVPIFQYSYMGDIAFSTRTRDHRGKTVWRTPRVPYSSQQEYQILTPSKLSPGNFSVVMVIDYKLNPLYRAEGEVEFINLLVNPKPKEVIHDNSPAVKDIRPTGKR